MALSMDGVSSYMNTQATNSANSAKADKTTSALSGLSATSSDEELTEAVESFEAYMLEQVIKQIKETVTSDDEDDSTSQIKSYYMDSTIQDLAKTMVSQYGGKLTEELVGQMKRNLGVTDTTATDDATTETVATE